MDYSDRFALPEGIYLLNHSVGRPPKRIWEKVTSGFYDAWAHGDTEPWGAWLEIVENFRNELARLLHAKPNEFCPQTNLSSGFTKILQSIPSTDERKTLLVSKHDFPSMGFVAKQAEKSGLTLRWLPKDFNFTNPDAWRHQLTDDLLAVFVSHVHYNSNTRVPVKSIVAEARQKGVLSIVDIAQSVGVVPIDLTDWNADVVVGSCVKWLCGGPGAGFLWVSEEAIGRFEPRDVGWFSHQNPFEFDIDHFQYASDALRFWGGTPSVLPFDVARHSIRELSEIGIDTVFKHNRMLTDVLVSSLDQESVVTPIHSDSRGGTLVIKVPQQSVAIERLTQANIKFDARALGIRLSPHIYNTTGQMHEVLDCLTSL